MTLAGAALWGQQAPARPAVEGKVTDTLGLPLPGAFVRRVGGRTAVVSDDSGRFRLTDVQVGSNAIEVRRLGYSRNRFTVDLNADSVAHVLVQLEPVAVLLDPLSVKANQIDSYLVAAGFYERLRHHVGAGVFITPEEYQRLRPQHFSQVLSSRPGLRMTYRGTRAIPWDRSGDCILNVFVDGVAIRDLYTVGMYSKQIEGIGIDGFVSPNVVVAVEIYPSGAGVPERFQTFGRCGAIVIWTFSDHEPSR